MQPEAAPPGIPRTSDGQVAVRSLDHVGLTVPALEPAVTFFQQVLDADLLYIAGPWTSEEPNWLRPTVEVGGATTLRLAMMRLGPFTNLELLEFSGSQEPSGPPPGLDAPNVAHLGFYVDDLEGTVATLRRLDNVRVLAGPVLVPDGQPSAGLRYIFARTPWGALLEFVTWPDGLPYEKQTPERLLPPARSWRWRP